MPITIEHTHFELSFSAAVLRKAQLLYSSGACERLHAGQALGSHFLVGDEDVRIKRKQKKVTEAFCSCNNGPLCAHVAAALFYLDGIQLPSTKRRTTKSKTQTLAQELRVVHQVLAGSSANMFEGMRPGNLRSLLLYFLGVHEVLSEAEKAEQLPKLEKKLRKLWSKRMPEEFQMLWLEAVLVSLRSNAVVEQGAYRFLLPLFLVAKHSLLQVAEIERVISRRSYKRFHQEGPDYLAIAALQIKLSSKPPSKQDIAAMHSAELLAYVDLLIAANRPDKAKRLLLFVLEMEKTSAQLFGSKLLFFAMQCAQKLNDKKVARAVLLQRLRESVQADETVLQELRDLYTATEFKAEMLKLAQATHDTLTEKKAILLMKSGDRKAMVDFAKLQPLRYHLLIQLLTEALPLVPSNVVPMLAGNITIALRQSPRLEWQAQVLKQCTPYLKALNTHQKNLVLEKVQANLGEQSHLAVLMQQLMN